MIKIKFWLKRPDSKQESLEYINIADPKVDKSKKFVWGNRYVCEIYFSDTKKTVPYYGINPIGTLFGAADFVKIHCQTLLRDDCVISEVENKEPWKLEKLSDNFIRDRINEIKNDPNIPQEAKDKILEGVDKVFKLD